MDFRKLLAELIGTFALTLIVRLSISFGMPISTPVLAALTLGLFVYTIGHLSGSHINPAVTLGILSIGKMEPALAAGYVIAQVIGALLALTLTSFLGVGTPEVLGSNPGLLAGFGEALGALFFTFGIASAVYGKVESTMAGVVVGGSLLLGIMMASGFSAGVLNPAVALGLMTGTVPLLYLVGPIVGSVGGFWLYKTVCATKTR